MGSNPIADTVLQQDHVGTTARWCCTSRASTESLNIEKVSLVTQDILGEVLRHFR